MIPLWYLFYSLWEREQSLSSSWKPCQLLWKSAIHNLLKVQSSDSDDNAELSLSDSPVLIDDSSEDDAIHAKHTPSVHSKVGWKSQKMYFQINLKWIPRMLTKINTFVYLNIVLGEKPQWKMQICRFYHNTLVFPKLPIKNNREFPTILKRVFLF